MVKPDDTQWTFLRGVGGDYSLEDERKRRLSLLRVVKAKDLPWDGGPGHWNKDVFLRMRFFRAPRRFVLDSPFSTLRRLRVLSTPVADGRVQALRKKYQRRKLVINVSGPLAFLLTVMFSTFGR